MICEHDLKKTMSQGDPPSHRIYCTKCGKRGEGLSEAEMMEIFEKSTPTQPQNLPVETAAEPIIYQPRGPRELEIFINQRRNEIIKRTLPFMRNDTPAFNRVLEKNIAYVFDEVDFKIWNTQEGQESIVKAFYAATDIGATLGEMGYMVSYGNKVEFIEKKEAFLHALTGPFAPFEWIEIETIYSEDKTSSGKENGEFFIKTAHGKPRGEISQIAVYGYLKDRKMRVGEVFDKDRLLAKAVEHSKSYQLYLKKVEEIEIAKSEGKKINDYVKSNPYAGADLPEMLSKVAAKTYLRPWLNSLGSYKASIEMEGASSQTRTEKIDDVLQNTKESIPGGHYEN